VISFGKLFLPFGIKALFVYTGTFFGLLRKNHGALLSDFGLLRSVFY
jgi:hypothetical protein